MDDYEGLDDLDRGIIAALQIDGRRTFSSLAEELHIPASSVRYRVNRLQEDRVLQVVGIANPFAIGFDRLAMIGVRVLPGSAGTVAAAMAAIAEASYVVRTSGQFDLMVEVICRDVEHFTTVLDTRIATIPGVVSTESFFVLEVHKLAYGWGVPGLVNPGQSREDATQDH